MKKLLLVSFAACTGFGAMAQNSSTLTNYGPGANTAVKYDVMTLTGDEVLPFSSVYSNPTLRNSNGIGTAAFNAVAIMNTGYGLQTNRAGRNAIVMNSDATISTGHIFSAQVSGWADRGTGYNYYDGTVWGASPSARIESIKVGWGEVAVTTSGKEHVLAHDGTAFGTIYNSRPVKGTGTWTENLNAVLSPSSGNLWPRLTSGGANGNSLHAISVTVPVANGGVKYLGQDGALCYARSTDDGVTWSSWSAPALHDSLSGYSDFAGDAYALDSRGDVVAYVFGSYDMSVTLMKSTNNGATWTKRTIKNFPIPNYYSQVTDTLPTNGIADTLWSTDGSMDVVIDNNNLVHVFFGAMRVFNDDPNAGGISFFPVTDGMYYWNETYLDNHPGLLPGVFVEDLDNSGMIELPTPTPSTDFPFGAYYTSMTSHPSAGVDANNNIYLVYDAVIEFTDEGTGHAYRNLYGMVSSSSGANWSTPLRFRSNDVFEQVYPNIAPHFTGTCIPITFMEDLAPGNGITLQGGGSTSPDLNNSYNEIMYGCLPIIDLQVGTHEFTNNLFNVSDNYPNPFNGNSAITITMNKASKVTLDIYSPLGAKVATTITSNLSTGEHTLNIDGSKLSAGMYFYTVRAGEFTVTKKMIVN